MNIRRAIPLLALLLAVASCDFKETRKGQITLTGAPISINGRSGPAQLVAGATEITFKKGSSDRSIAIKVKQPNRADVEFEAPVEKGYESGNFTLKGSAIGQPVDMVSARAWTVTGPTERYVDREDRGNQSCLVEVRYDPCDENWTVGFKDASGADLGSFSSRKGARCNEQRGFPYACHRDPIHDRPDFPRGPRSAFHRSILDIAPANLQFD